jgi:hippurate hydrolase
MMAAADRFSITIHGKGGHAARPHDTVDPVVVASHVIMALQTIASRNVDPLDSAVVSVCSVRAGEAFNVIPQDAVLLGTVRTLKEEIRDTCEARIHMIVDNVCAAFGAQATITYHRGYPVTFNDPDKTEFMTGVARQVAGEKGVHTEIPPLMGAEDFSYMLLERPGAYIFVGNGDTAGVHHPAYDFNDEAAPYGVSLFAKIVESGMPAR